MSHTIGESLLPEFDAEMDHTRRILERVPELEGAFTPHPKSMTLRRLAGHVAEMPLWAVMTLGHDEVDLGPDGDYAYKAYELTRTSEALAFFDLDVDGEDGDIGVFDVFGGELVFDAHGALGLDADGVAEGLGGFLELLGGHVGVGDAGGAGGDGDDFHGELGN